MSHVTQWKAGKPVHPLITAASQVEMRERHPYYPAKKLRDDVLKAANRVRILATEDDCPFPDLDQSFPLAGLTRARARIVRDVLRGYPVRFWTVNDERFNCDNSGTLGVFDTIVLEGDWVWGAITCAFDLRISTSWSEYRFGPGCGGGTKRILGVGALSRLEVLSMDRWFVCRQCGAWRPREAVRDVNRWFLSDPDLKGEYYADWECREHEDDSWYYPQ